MELPALQSFKDDISPDIYPGLLEWVFDCDTFQRWRRDTGAWQMHCIGGPGSGKTTLAKLVSQHLKRHPQHQGHTIISAYIEEDVLNDQIDLVEAFLVTVYRGLVARKASQCDESARSYQEYEHWYKRCGDHSLGVRRWERLQCLRKAVHARLGATKDDKKFLILDGIDRCGPTVRYMLETELACLQHEGVKLLLTSRSATFEQKQVLCDHECHDETNNNPLDMYLQCQTAECGGYTLCYVCHDAGRICHDCHVDGSLFVPYDHVNMRLWVPTETMEKFVAWDLEREHGDLGLKSSASKPPLSDLGKSLLLNRDSYPVETLVSDIATRSYQNIGMARARLDLVHEMESVDGLLARKEQLPATIVALFDCGLKAIEAQPADCREIALKALASAARYGDGESVNDLIEQLQGLQIPGIRSGEEIVEASRGWLVDIMVEGPQRLKVYNTNFVYYVEQKYHRGIHRSSVQLEAYSRGSSFANVSAHQPATTARFEPQNIFEEPQDINPFKLARTVTTMPAIEEAPIQPFVVRKGTVAWS